MPAFKRNEYERIYSIARNIFMRATDIEIANQAVELMGMAESVLGQVHTLDDPYALVYRLELWHERNGSVTVQAPAPLT